MNWSKLLVVVLAHSCSKSDASSLDSYWCPSCIQSNLYIKGTQGHLKRCPLLAVALYIWVNLHVYALFINGKMRLSFIESDVLYNTNNSNIDRHLTIYSFSWRPLQLTLLNWKLLVVFQCECFYNAWIILSRMRSSLYASNKHAFLL
jgi:hypothetical protein